MFLVFFCPFFKVKTNLNLYSLGDQARPSGTMKINSNKSEIQTRHNKHTAQWLFHLGKIIIHDALQTVTVNIQAKRNESLVLP